MKKIKKIIIVSIILLGILSSGLLIPQVCFANLNTHPNNHVLRHGIYGNVYVFDKNITIIAWLLFNVKPPTNGVYELKLSPLVLINKGEIINVHFRLGGKNYIVVVDNGNIYWLDLKPYMLGINFILFTFGG